MSEQTGADRAKVQAGPKSHGALVVVCVVAIFCVLGLLVWALSVPPDRSRNSNGRALMEIEKLGGTVPHDWIEESYSDSQPVYRTFFLDVTLGPEWTGGNDGLALFRDAGEVFDLTLDNPRIDDRGLAELRGIRLGGLIAKATQITDAGLRHLSDTHGLQLLRLDGSQITDAGLEAIRGHDLIWLMLEGDCRVTDAGLVHLSGMRNLIRLGLPGAEVTRVGLPHLSPLVQLRSLVLRNTQVDDPSLRHLAGLERLQRLDLAGTRVTGSGLAHLKPLPRLEELYLDDTSLSDDDLQQLAELEQLVFVSLTGTRVTKAGLETLDKMPRLRTALLDTEGSSQ